MQDGKRRGSLLGVLDQERARLARRLAQQADDPASLALSLRAEFVDVPRSFLHRGLQARAERLAIALEDGASLSEAMSDRPGDFSDWEVALVSAAEASPEPRLVLRAWSERLSRASELKDGLSSLLLYPFTLLLIAAGSWLLLLRYAIPVLASLYTQAGLELPLSTRLIVAASNVVAFYGLELAFGAFLLLLMVSVGATTAPGRSLLSGLRYRLPLLGWAARSADRAVLLQALASLAAAGRPAVEALRSMASALPSLAARAELERATARLEEGEAIEEGKAGPLLDKPTRRALARAWAAPEPRVALDRFAASEEARARRVVSRAFAILEPLAITSTGLLVAFSLFAAMHPLYALAGVVAEAVT